MAGRIAARIVLPRLLEAGQDETVTLVLYRGASPVHPTAVGSTYTLTDDSGAVIVSGAVAVDTGGVASFVVGGTFTATRDYSDRWLEEWSLIVNGVAIRVQCDALNVRRKLYNVVTQDDLKRPHPGIVAEQLPPEIEDFSGFIDEAFEELERDLIERGNRPNLIVSPWSCRKCVIAKTLALIYTNAITNANGETDRFRALADKYEAVYTASFPKLTYKVDADEDGTVAEQMPVAQPVVFLSSTPRASRTGLGE